MSGWIGLLHPSLVLFAAGAWMAGRAVALTWGSPLTLAFYVAALAAAARFLGYALFGEPLLSPPGYLMALVVVGAAGALAYRVTRVRQMATRYAWAFERAGPLSYRRRAGGPASAGG